MTTRPLPIALALVTPCLPLLAGCGVSPEFADYPEDAPYVPAPIAAEPVEAPAVSRAGNPDLLGRFEGVGHQDGGVTWPVSVSITELSEGTCAVVRFPNEGCSGYWQCRHVHGDELVAVEHITEGRDKCVDGVIIHATLVGDSTLAFAANAGGGIKAAGKLHRTR